MPFGAPARTSSGALAMPISTVGAAQNMVIFSSLISRKMRAGSTCLRHTWAMPRAVLIQMNVQPLAWNMGRVHRYRSPGPRLWWAMIPMTFM